MKTLKDVYKDHAEMPFILPKYEQELLKKPIAKRQMKRTKEGYLPGHIILLWRINFGSYTTHHPHHKYFYTTYGIDPQKELEHLISAGFVRIDTAFDSVKLLSVNTIKELLQEKSIKGLSKLKRADLEALLETIYTEETLALTFDERSYSLTRDGVDLLERYPDIVAKHPQKKY